MSLLVSAIVQKQLWILSYRNINKDTLGHVHFTSRMTVCSGHGHQVCIDKHNKKNVEDKHAHTKGKKIREEKKREKRKGWGNREPVVVFLLHHSTTPPEETGTSIPLGNSRRKVVSLDGMFSSLYGLEITKRTSIGNVEWILKTKESTDSVILIFCRIITTAEEKEKNSTYSTQVSMF